jgi:hypothetical protein
LAKAKECERLATQARDPMVKATYRELVQQWHDLAEQIRELTRWSSALFKLTHYP